MTSKAYSDQPARACGASRREPTIKEAPTARKIAPMPPKISGSAQREVMNSIFA
jgi:hypothetical protein